MAIYMGGGRIPSIYQEVEYIEANGTQYIDTGVKGKNNMIAEAKYMFNSLGSTNSDNYILGSAGSWPNYMLYIGKRGNGGSHRFSSSIANSWFDTSGIEANKEYTQISSMLKSGITISVNGSVIRTGSYGSDYNNGINLGIFAQISNSGVNNYSDAKLWYLTIKEADGTLVRNFVPCYRKSDGVIGLYDLVGNQFYTNSGTGTFNKGLDVKQTPKYIVTGYEWLPGDNTIAYYPLEKDGKDYSGNGYHGTWRTSPTYETSSSTKVAALFSSNWLALPMTTVNMTNWTISFWAKSTSSGTWQEVFDANQSGQIIYAGYYGPGNTNIKTYGVQVAQSSSSSYVTSHGNQDNTGWCYVTLVGNSSGLNTYINGVAQTGGSGNSSITSWSNPGIGARRNGSTNYFSGYISEFIIENKNWSGEEISRYFDLTKGNYGYTQSEFIRDDRVLELF